MKAIFTNTMMCIKNITHPNSLIYDTKVNHKLKLGMTDNKIIDVAASKGRTIWLQNLLKELLPQLNLPSTDYQTWLKTLLEVMEHRGLTQPTQQKDYLSDVRNAIRVLDPNHPALEIVDFDTNTWIEINNRASDRLGERQTKLIDHPDKIVKRATTLLGSYQWSEIACGLAVVTGRRSTEVIKTAQFEYKSKYSLTFTGALKRGNEPVELSIEIPTLCEARLVIDAIARIRSQLGSQIQDLSKRQVSSRYGRAVATKCDRYFDELVPPREDQDNLYTHLFRAVYATIASYWYCPPSVPEIEFRAAIQGHYQIIDEKDPKLRRSIAASRNYFDYRIGDGHGNIDGRLGIKLGLPDVEVIAEFRTAQIPPPSPSQSDCEARAGGNGELASPCSTPARRHRILRSLPDQPQIMNQSSNSASANSMVIPSFFQSRLSTIADKLGISPAQAIQALFTWTEMSLSLAEQLSVDELTPQAIFKSVEDLRLKASNSLSLRDGLDSTDSADLDSHSLNQLSTSIRLLSETLSNKHNQIRDARSAGEANRSKGPRHRESSQNTPVDNQNHNSSPPVTTQLVQPPLKSTSSNQHARGTWSGNPTYPLHQQQDDRKLSNRSQEAEAEVNRAIDAIIDFNNQDSLPHNDKWHIGVGALRKLTHRGDTVAQRVLKQRADQIQQHHAQHQIAPRHNSKGKTHPSIHQVISL